MNGTAGTSIAVADVTLSTPEAGATAPIRVLIADGDAAVRELLAAMLTAEPGVELVGMVASGGAAVADIRRQQPQVVFLEVHLPGCTGIDVARQIGAEAMPATIFVTADDSHAVEAFELAAVDYVVKPFDEERVRQAFRRARRMVELEQMETLRAQLLALLGGVPAGAGGAAPTPAEAMPAVGALAEGYLERIAVETRGKVIVVPVAELDYVVASGPYAELHVGDRRYLIRESMQALEEKLDPEQFLRVHRSIIVRLALIEALLKGSRGDYAVQLKTGERLRVGRSRREAVERRLGVSP